MSNVSNAINLLGTQLSATFTSATICYEIPNEIDNNTSFPLFVINVMRGTQENFAVSTLSQYTLQVIFYNRTTLDKTTIDALQEKFEYARSVKSSIQSWFLGLLNVVPGVGAISNIDTNYLETLDNGEYGGLTTKTIRLAFQFSFTIKEL